MFKQILIVCSALSMVFSEPPVPQYGVPFNNNNNAGGGGGYNSYNNQNAGHGVNNGVGTPISSYGTPNYDNNQGGGHGHDHHDNNDGYGEPKAYEFGYQVKDDYTGTNYNRQEQSDGNQVTGSYRVALPDGRTQIVTYYADWKTGFHADVRYEGEAQYPQTYNTNNNNNNGGYNYNNNNQNYNNNNNNNNADGYNYNTNNQQQGYQNNNNYNQNQNYNANQNYNTPSNQYGTPSVNPIAINNQYAALSTGSGYDNYNNNNNNNQNYNYNNAQQSHQQNNYDSYANSGFGNKVKPTSVYGAP